MNLVNEKNSRVVSSARILDDNRAERDRDEITLIAIGLLRSKPKEIRRAAIPMKQWHRSVVTFMGILEMRYPGFDTNVFLQRAGVGLWNDADELPDRE